MKASTTIFFIAQSLDRPIENADILFFIFSVENSGQFLTGRLQKRKIPSQAHDEIFQVKMFFIQRKKTGSYTAGKITDLLIENLSITESQTDSVRRHIEATFIHGLSGI